MATHRANFQCLEFPKYRSSVLKCHVIGADHSFFSLHATHCNRKSVYCKFAYCLLEALPRDEER